MKKYVLILLCLPLLLTGCSKPKTPTAKFLYVCRGFMQAADEMKAAVKTAHQDIHQQGLVSVSSNLAAIMMIYQTKISKPYGDWEKACFVGVKQQKQEPVCTTLVNYVTKPECAAATESTYAALYEKKKN